MFSMRHGSIVSIIVCMLLVLVCAPSQVFAAGQNAGMVTFTDSDADHFYAKGDNISFRMGPFPCQAGKKDYLVLGVMEEGNSGFAVSSSPLEGLSSSEKGYYLSVTADSEGFFNVSGQISTAADQLPTGVLAIKIYSQDWNMLVNEKTGTEAFIPVVATDGTPALIMGKLSTGQSTDPFLENSLAKVADNNDLDQVYFQGQRIVINYTLPASIPLPEFPIDQLTVTSGVFVDEQTFNTAVSPLTNTSIIRAGSGFSIQATINNPDNLTLPSGVLGIQLKFPLTIPGASSLQQPMPVVSSLGKAAIVGVKVPSAMFVDATPLLADIQNLYNTEQSVTFTKGSQGSITFVPGLNIIDNRNELAALDKDINLNFDQERESFVFEVKTNSLSFLKGKSAGIKAYGVMEKLKLDNLSNENIADLINMAVVDENGQPVPESMVGDYIDQSNVAYDSNTDILTIPVKHFTRYEIGKKNSNERVEAPIFNPSSGTYKTAQAVTIHSVTPGASIRYTLNGSNPTASSALYLDPIIVNLTTEVKAKAFKQGMADSDIVSSIYTIVAETPIYKKLTVTPASINLKLKKTTKFSVKATPAKGKPVNVTAVAVYESSNPSVVNVNKGVVTAVGKGDAVITIKYGGLEKMVKARVK